MLKENFKIKLWLISHSKSMKVLWNYSKLLMYWYVTTNFYTLQVFTVWLSIIYIYIDFLNKNKISLIEKTKGSIQ